MNSYIQQLFPFVDMGNFVKNTSEVVDATSIYCPVDFEISDSGNVVTKSQKNPFNAYKITPCNVIVVDENDSVLKDIKSGVYGDKINLNVIEMDYSDMASRIEVLDNVARVPMNKGYMSQEVLSDIFINSASNGFNITSDMIPDVMVKPEKKVSFKDWITSSIVNESADAYKDLLNDFNTNGGLDSNSTKKVDSVYEWLDAYFALPEGASVKTRSEVPLLIGPTGVFKSSTVKELCKKYGYRLIDFRAAFTSRLDYSGLYQMGSVDDQLYSYSCPMEELVTCSDGFIEYCRRAYDRVSKILADGYIISDKVSNGETEDGNKVTLTDEQREKLENLLSKYKEYMKPVCLFVDEITRVRDSGVNGILTEMLNQKRFNNMPMKSCKFVAATNANLMSRTDDRHNQYMDDLDRMYDVNDELDIAFSNRFIPLLVRPEDVQDRWFEWAGSPNKISTDGTQKVSNIHEIVIEYLNGDGYDQVYNDKPILDAIEKGLTDNEQKSQPFPNYRTWEMVSNYMYSIDSDYEEALKDVDSEKDKNDIKKVYRPKVIKGLISEESGQKFIDFLKTKDYVDIESSLGREVDDEYSDFLQTSLDAGVPALMVGPSSIGKTSRVEQYMRRQKDRTGLEPVLINIDLASKDAVDLMGMPAKVSLVDYVAGKDLEDLGLGDVRRELSETVKSVQQEDMYGLSDYLTVRSPDLTVKESLVKAKREGRDVIFFFDECFTGDTKIRLYDGRVLSFNEINDEYSERDEFLVYSLNEDGDLVYGKAHTLGITRRNSELVEVSLSNGITLKCTPEHPFMLEDGTYCEARDLSEGIELSAGKDFDDDVYVPIKITVDSVRVIDEIADVYDIEVEEYHNFLVDVGNDSGIFVHNCNRVKSTTVLSSMFEVVSDKRFANVDFSEMADKVKIIAACNMSHSEMLDDEVDYSEAGSIDPALAARFSVFWKKNYDEKDVKSWIAYMEDQKAKGTIDGTLLEFFKSLPIERAIKVIASVEKRKLIYAEPSTRSMTQLSRDIKSMRGVSGSGDTKLYYGKLLFDNMTREELANIYDTLGSDPIDTANKIDKLVNELLAGRDTWDALLSGQTITVNGKVLTAEDLLDNIEACLKDIKNLLAGPVTQDKAKELNDLENFIMVMLQYCNNLDDGISQRRRAFFEQYVGEEFTKEFLPYFNENFGSENDVEITIEMLSDKSLVRPFFKKYRSKTTMLTEEQYEDNMIEVMREFLNAHGTSLQPDVYSSFIDGVKNSLASVDGWDRLLKNVPSDLDPLFERAEQVGDAWIVDMLLSSRISLQDIADMRNNMSNTVVSAGNSKSRATLL